MPQEKESIRAGQIEVRFLLESKDSTGQLAMFEFTVPAGAKVPLPHSHAHYDETIYGLEAEAGRGREGVGPVNLQEGVGRVNLQLFNYNCSPSLSVLAQAKSHHAHSLPA